MKPVGVILKEQRIAKNMTLKDLSDKSGISVVSLTKYEHSQVMPTVRNFYTLTQVLGLNYDELYPVFEQEKNGKTR